MKKLLITFISLFLLTACGSKEPLVIESDMPGVQLEIPESAMPDGISAKDISISAMSLSEIPSDLPETEFTAYKLEPDGLRFDEPVNVTIPVTNGISPFMHYSNGNLNFIQDVNYVFSPNGNFARVPLTHFSVLIGYIGTDEVFVVEGDTQDSYVGEQVDSSVTVTLDKTEWTTIFKGSKGVSWSFVDGTQTIENFFSGDNITPSYLKNSPPTTSFGKSYIIKPEGIVCESEGPAALEYDIQIHWKSHAEGLYAIGSRIVGPIGDRVHVIFETYFKCLKKTIPPPEPVCGDGKIWVGRPAWISVIKLKVF
jgi:hypothetical protein